MVVIESGKDGRPGVASLEPSDDALLRGLFSRLSAASVYRRFFSPITRPEPFLASFRDTPLESREAVAAVVGGEIVGVAQYSRLRGSPRADMAVVVADNWQRQGIGTRLVAVLADRAVAKGIDAFDISVQADNFASLRLIKRFAPDIRLAISGGVGEGVIELPWGAKG